MFTHQHSIGENREKQGIYQNLNNSCRESKIKCSVASVKRSQLIYLYSKQLATPQRKKEKKAWQECDEKYTGLLISFL